MLRPVTINKNIRGRLYLHSMPGRYEGWLDFIKAANALGVTHILCLTPEEEIKKKSPDYYQALTEGAIPFKIFHFPIQDYGIPSEAAIPRLANILEVIQRSLIAEEVVLIHCAGGIGRTGMVATLLLVKLGNSVEEAIRLIKNAGSSPETDEQKNLLLQVASTKKDRRN